MIISTYQGVGKSTICKKSNKCIDLESSSFFIDGKRNDNWYKEYVKIAHDLFLQGYIVFISSHKEVRVELNKTKDDKIIIIYPSINLKDKWIDKLKERYESAKLVKDFKALKNAEDKYEESINEFDIESTFINISCNKNVKYLTIYDMDYNFEEFLKEEGVNIYE